MSRWCYARPTKPVSRVNLRHFAYISSIRGIFKHIHHNSPSIIDCTITFNVSYIPVRHMPKYVQLRQLLTRLDPTASTASPHPRTSRSTLTKTSSSLLCHTSLCPSTPDLHLNLHLYPTWLYRSTSADIIATPVLHPRAMAPNGAIHR